MAGLVTDIKPAFTRGTDRMGRKRESASRRLPRSQAGRTTAARRLKA